MKTAPSIILTTLGIFAIGLTAPPTGAQRSVPSPSEITGALLPMPKALQTTRGLPQPGIASRPEPNTAVAPISAPARPSKPAAPEGRPHGAPAASVDTRPAGPAKIGLDTIQFEFGSDRLKPDSLETLRNLGTALNQGLKDQKIFLIEGHTDAVGNPKYNTELSKRRADAVKDFLVHETGVAADRLQTVGKGSSEPAVPKNPFAAQNRRVVVVNLGA
jgi:OmpA-OmpF porin, OOP family